MSDQELRYTFTGDWSSLKRSVDDMLASFRDLDKQARTAAAGIASIGHGIKSGLGGVGAKIKSDVVDPLKNLSMEVERAKNGLKSIVVTAAGFTTAMGAALAAPTKAFADFESQLNSFRAVSSATIEEMKQFEAMSLSLGQATSKSASEIAKAGVELTKMGLSATQAMQAMPGIISGAEAAGESLEKVSGVVVAVMNGFRMEASDSQKIVDVLAKTANLSATSIGEMGVAFQYTAAVGKIANQSFESVSTALGIVTNSGIQASAAGNQLQNMFTRLSAPPKAAADVIETFGLKVQTAEGKLKAWPAIMEELRSKFVGLSDTKVLENLKDLFGDVALPSAAVLFQTTGKEIDDFEAKLMNAGGSAEETAKIMRQGLNYQLEQLKGSIETAAISIGKELAPSMMTLIKMAQGAVEWFNQLSPTTKRWIANLALLATAAGVLITALGGLGLAIASISSGILTIISAVNSAKLAFTALQGYMLATAETSTVMSTAVRAAWSAMLGPIGWVVAAVAAFALAYSTNFAGIKDITDGFLEFIQPALTDLGKWFDGVANTITLAFKGTFTNVKIIFMGIEEIIKNSMGVIGNAMAVLGLAIRGEFGAAKEAALALGESLKGIGSGLSKVILPGLQEDPTKFKQTDLREKTAAIRKDNFNRMVGAGVAAPSGFIPREAPKSKDELDKLKKEADDAAKERERERVKELEKQLNGEKERHEFRMQNIEKEFAKEHSHAKEIVDLSKSAAGGVQTSGYGMRIHPIKGTANVHSGIDFGAASGTPIKAPAAATVAFSGVAGGYGNAVILDLGGGNYVLYGHGSKLYKKVGDSVKKGETVAAVGSTGMSTGAHLHQEARVGAPGLRGAAAFNASPVNPNTKTAVSVSSEDAHEVEKGKRMQGEAQAYLVKLLQIQKQLKSQGATAKELEIIEKEIFTARKAAGDKEIDLIKARQKAEDEAIKAAQEDYKEHLKTINSGYDDLIKNAKSVTDELAKEHDAYVEQKATEGMDDIGKLEYESKKKIAAADAEIAALMEKQAAAAQEIKDIQDQNKDTKINVDIQKELNSQLANQGALEKQLKDLKDQRLKQIDDEADKMANAKFAKARQQEVDDFEKQDKAVNDLIADKEKLAQWFADLESGKVKMEDFADGLGVTTQQAERLSTAIAGVDFDKKADAAQKAAQKLKDDLSNAFDIAATAVYLAGEALSKFGSVFGETGQKVSDVAGVFLGSFSQIANAAQKALKGDLIGAIQAAGTVYFDMLGKLFFPDQAQIEKQKASLIDQIKKADDEIMRMRKEHQEGSRVTSSDKDIDDQIKAARDSAEKQIKELYEINKNIFGVVTVDISKDIKKIGDYMEATIGALNERRKDLATQNAADIEAINNESYIRDGEAKLAQYDKDRDAYFQSLEDKAKAEDAARDASQKKQADYFTKQNRERAVNSLAGELIDQYQGPLSDPQAEEALGAMMKSAASEWAGIYQNIIDTFEAGAERDAELSKAKVAFDTKLKISAVDAVAKYQEKTSKELADKQKKSVEDLQKDLVDKLNTLKRLKQDALKAELKPMEAVVKAEEERLKVIKKQIEARNKLREQELESFKSTDQGEFAAKVGSVDLNAFIRQGLGDIHNPDGVNTETYDPATQREAVEQRLKLMRQENEAKLTLEQISFEQYQAKQIEIAAITAAFAKKQLENDKLDSVQRGDLLDMLAQAYKDFKDVRISQINAAADADIAAKEKEKQASEDVISDQKDKMAQMTETAQDGFDLIQEAIDGTTESQMTFTGSIRDTIAALKEQHEAAKKLAYMQTSQPNAVSAGDKVNDMWKKAGGFGAPSTFFPATTVPKTTSPWVESTSIPSRDKMVADDMGVFSVPGDDGKWYRTSSEMDKAKLFKSMLGGSFVGNFKDGGTVPGGFPNDTGFAAVTSGEEISRAGAGRGGDVNITLTGNTFKSDIDVKRALLDGWNQAIKFNPNSSYTGLLN